MTYTCQILLTIQSVFESATVEAEKVNALTFRFIIAGSFIFLLVVGLLIYVSVKFRAKPDAEPIQVRRNKKAEVAMIGIPFLMVAFFFYLTIKTMEATEPPVQNQKPDIIIVGHQWWWEARYPVKNVVTANEIHIPVQKKVLLQLNSGDVIHDWWVPSFGPKMDMVPGINNYLWLYIRKPGIYEGTCSEFCGVQHAWMRIRVIAQDTGDFQRWLTAEAMPALQPITGPARSGRTIFMGLTCAGCHTIKGTVAMGRAGPDLTHLASRETLLSGKMENTDENLEKWLSHPQKIKPGAHMPDFIFNKDTITALVAYLHTLQ